MGAHEFDDFAYFDGQGDRYCPECTESEFAEMAFEKEHLPTKEDLREKGIFSEYVACFCCGRVWDGEHWVRAVSTWNCGEEDV